MNICAHHQTNVALFSLWAPVTNFSNSSPGSFLTRQTRESYVTLSRVSTVCSETVIHSSDQLSAQSSPFPLWVQDLQLPQDAQHLPAKSRKDISVYNRHITFKELQVMML